MGTCASHDACASSWHSYADWIEQLATLAGRELVEGRIEFDSDCCQFGHISPTSAARLADELEDLLPRIEDDVTVARDTHGWGLPMRSWTVRFVAGLRRAATTGERLELSG